ncbi:adenylate kinase family protein [Halopenitus persicus]|uniref:Putative adenylate kinase n=1 Tax=Halopenitus persicus TaxID=1048396 RepID=A0A1H3HQK6_9EURY|nr:adenylate kinase family protein [Halopenitus persicus]QHS15877.1 AAA family ATPase [haloarchaeon 3A1-DGR]SDY17757.1 adenylate kinase [Halopenitus persicus]
MRVAVTGTPGTGKTSATRLLESEEGGDHTVIHLNELIESDEDLWTERDDDRGSLVADLEAIADRLGDWDGILESHLAHYFDADRVVVLRCAPETLEERLTERGEPPAKARENAESEALDVILSEAVERFGREHVHEIDTTDAEPAAVAAEIEAVIDGDREPSAGTVDFTGYL